MLPLKFEKIVLALFQELNNISRKRCLAQKRQLKRPQVKHAAQVGLQRFSAKPQRPRTAHFSAQAGFLIQNLLTVLLGGCKLCVCRFALLNCVQPCVVLRVNLSVLVCQASCLRPLALSFAFVPKIRIGIPKEPHWLWQYVLWRMICIFFWCVCAGSGSRLLG